MSELKNSYPLDKYLLYDTVLEALLQVLSKEAATQLLNDLHKRTSVFPRDESVKFDVFIKRFAKVIESDLLEFQNEFEVFFERLSKRIQQDALSEVENEHLKLLKAFLSVFSSEDSKGKIPKAFMQLLREGSIVAILDEVKYVFAEEAEDIVDALDKLPDEINDALSENPEVLLAGTIKEILEEVIRSLNADGLLPPNIAKLRDLPPDVYDRLISKIEA